MANELTKFNLRQHIRAQLSQVLELGLYGVSKPSPEGTLRGIDVLGTKDTTQKLTRAAIIYAASRKKYFDLLNPMSFYEKLVISKFFAAVPMPSPADKIALEPFLPPITETFSGVFPIKWRGSQPINSALIEQLGLQPGRYYAKSNAGSGTNISFEVPLSNEKEKTLQNLTTSWLDLNHGKRAGEWWYTLIRPQNYIETDMSDGTSDLTDWKFHVGGGNILAVQVDIDRSRSHTQLMYDRNFRFIDEEMFFKTGDPLSKPKYYEDLREIAELIALRFEYARVDLYQVNGRIYLGEITLCPMGGLRTPKSAVLDAKIGQEWQGGFFAHSHVSTS
jgi:hypothetical protein